MERDPGLVTRRLRLAGVQSGPRPGLLFVRPSVRRQRGVLLLHLHSDSPVFVVAPGAVMTLWMPFDLGSICYKPEAGPVFPC